MPASGPLAVYQAAVQALARGDARSAESLAEQAALAFARRGDQDNASRCRLLGCRTIAAQGELARAEEQLRDLAADADRRGLISRSLAARTDLGALQEQQGQLGEAMATHRTVLDLQIQAGDPQGEAVAAANVGRLLWRMAAAEQRPQAQSEARELLQRAGRLFRGAQRPLQAAQVLLVLGDMERHVGHPQRALATFDDALAVAVAANHPGLLAQTHLNRGLVLRDLGQRGDAESELQRAVAQAKSSGDAMLTLRCRQALALAQADSHKPHALEQVFSQLAADWQAIGQAHMALPALANRASALARQGDFNGAHRDWQQVRRALEQAGERQQALDIRLALAELAWTRGHLAELADHLHAIDHPEASQRMRHGAALLHAAMAAESLDLQACQGFLNIALDGEPSRATRFSAELQALQIAVLRRDPQTAELLAQLAAQAHDSPREQTLVLQAHAETLAWQGDFTGARRAVMRAQQAWAELEEPVPLAAAGVWAVLLRTESAPTSCHLADIAELLIAQGAESRALALQLAEAVAMHRADVALRQLERLVELGRRATAATLAWLSSLALNSLELQTFSANLLHQAGLPPLPLQVQGPTADRDVSLNRP